MAFETIDDFSIAMANLPAPDARAIVAATARQAQLTKPTGALGRLESLAIFFAGWQGRAIPSLDYTRNRNRKDAEHTDIRAVVFAANHGVAIHNVSAFPASVTAEMVANFEAGGAAINALSRLVGMRLQTIAIDLDCPTADFTCGAAMSEAECLAAMSIGARAVSADIGLLVLGEMGIANSTAAALCALSFGGSGGDWVGAGTGLDAEAIAHKACVVDQALRYHRADLNASTDRASDHAPGRAAHSARRSFEILRRVGGREIAAIAGAVLCARQQRIPVLLDGFICCSALAPLVAAAPDITTHCLAGHCSSEAAHARLLDKLVLEPLLHLDMRLGEASGAAVAVSIVQAALATHREMASFAQAGVSTKTEPTRMSKASTARERMST